MVILQLKIMQFGKLKDREISLRPGMNVITGDNESGKSTIGMFIKAMIYGLDPAGPEYGRYLPYGFESGVFGGAMKVLVDGAFYEIFRNFLVNEEKLTITKQSDGSVVDDPEYWLLKAVSGVSRERYEETGFAAQFSLQQDLRKWSGSSLTASGEEEMKIRNRCRKAKKSLEDKRADFVSRLEPGMKEQYLEVSAESEEKTARLADRRLESEDNLSRLQKMEQDLERDAKRVETENREYAEKIRGAMMESKRLLEPYQALDVSKRGKKSILGAVFMTCGIALAVLMLYARSAWQIHVGSSIRFYCMLGGFALAFVLFAVGLALTIIRASKNAQLEKSLKLCEKLKARAEEDEKNYQYFLDHREEVEQKIDKQAFREQTIETMRERQAILNSEIDTLEKETEDLAVRTADLKARYEEQQSFEIEIRSLDLAIESLGKLGAASSAAANEVLAEGAMGYLAMLDKRKKDRLVIADDNTTSLITENGEIALSDLSMSAAQEVILTIRLAAVDENDPNRTLPIILDDVFAGFDTERLNSCLNLLRSLSRQIILFSSQTRERKLL